MAVAPGRSGGGGGGVGAGGGCVGGVVPGPVKPPTVDRFPPKRRKSPKRRCVEYRDARPGKRGRYV